MKELAVFFLSVCTPLAATEYLPWLGLPYAFESRFLALGQRYTSVDCSGEAVSIAPRHDLFLTASVCMALPDDVSIEGEVIGARTCKQASDIDHLKVTGRYLIADDVRGDPLSWVVGASISPVFHTALRDISSFHHGRFEGELWSSFGREWAEETWWTKRWWGLVAMGMADWGSPWVRLAAVYERQWQSSHAIRLSVHALGGTGENALSPHHFQGYGSIQHLSLDLSARYTYSWQEGEAFYVTYLYRPYACNFPRHCQQLMVQVYYQFGL